TSSPSIRAIVGSLVVVAVAILALGLPMTLPTMLGCAFILFGAGQVIKLCVDATIQTDIGDESRGRVFSLYDTLFNITTVVAIALAATVVPSNGHSPGLVVVIALVYLLGIVGFVLVTRKRAA
ncbi:MFS transporter, partial [Kibdelosporangium lantanae]